MRIARRAACDRQPIDLRQPEQSLRLGSFIWPDQTDRLARLHAARQAAAAWMAREGVRVEALPALRFVERELAAPPAAGHATVLMHSLVWPYIHADEQAAIASALESAGRRATAAAPLAWLRLEPNANEDGVELRCRLWPAAPQDRVLARGHAHVEQLHWLGSDGA